MGTYVTLLFGGGKRDRTADLLHAMQALSQLSYTPKKSAHYNDRIHPCKAEYLFEKRKPADVWQIPQQYPAIMIKLRTDAAAR